MRPAVVIQTDLLNHKNPTSYIVCPTTTKDLCGDTTMRLPLKANRINNLGEDCEVLIDQVRAIDKSRFVQQLGPVTDDQLDSIVTKLINIMELYDL